MKGLDSSAILALLHGDRAIERTLRSWAGEEIATSELCLIELTAMLLGKPPRIRASRLEALARLRRRLSVLPVDHRVQAILAARSGAVTTPGALQMATILATLEAAGCDEVLTVGRTPSPIGRWKLRVRCIRG